LIRIVIIASSIALRAGLAALISDEPQMEVMAEAANLFELGKLPPEADVVVWAPGSSIDENGSVGDNIDLNIEETATLLMIEDDPTWIEFLTQLKIRAWGLIGTEFTKAELITSIQCVNEGLVVTDPHWIKQAINPQKNPDEANQNLIDPLTAREVEILQLLAYGLTNKQIAAKLVISAHTVKFHISMIYNKMGTSNRVETVNLGLKMGLIAI
jgi:NarL family two-component system response regulator YdfI